MAGPLYARLFQSPRSSLRCWQELPVAWVTRAICTVKFDQYGRRSMVLWMVSHPNVVEGKGKNSVDSRASDGQVDLNISRSVTTWGTGIDQGLCFVFVSVPSNGGGSFKWT
jgi:hypothetical protein